MTELGAEHTTIQVRMVPEQEISQTEHKIGEIDPGEFVPLTYRIEYVIPAEIQLLLRNHLFAVPPVEQHIVLYSGLSGFQAQIVFEAIQAVMQKFLQTSFENFVAAGGFYGDSYLSGLYALLKEYNKGVPKETPSDEPQQEWQYSEFTRSTKHPGLGSTDLS